MEDKYEEESPTEPETQPEEKMPMLSKALAGLGDPDADMAREEDTTLQAGRYGAPQQSLPGTSTGPDADDEDDDDNTYSQKETATESMTGDKTSTLPTAELHPGMYSERDPILKNAPKKSGGGLGGYDGPLGKVAPHGGLKVRFSCVSAPD